VYPPSTSKDPPDGDALEVWLRGAGFELPGRQEELLSRYVSLLRRWNRRINLVSSTAGPTLRPLILEAVWAAERYPASFCRHLDIGSGGGFPALPLAILRSDVEVTLLESRGRKAAFLETAAFELGLLNVRVENQRLDRYLRSMERPGLWQCISWKAVKLSKRELRQLLKTTTDDISLWIFHGDEWPFEGSPSENGILLTFREPCPGGAGWHLSQFVKTPVSRETP
jgi:16S rRNA (guanine527-N7)-methyltransferase